MKKHLPNLDRLTHRLSKNPKSSGLRGALASVLLMLFVILGQSTTAQIAFSEGFNSASLPAGWVGTGFSSAALLPCEGTNHVQGNRYSSSPTGTLVSPSIGTSNGGVISLSFQYKVTDWSAGIVGTPANFGTVEVQYGPSATGPWTTVYTINSLNHVVSASCATVNVPSFSIANGPTFLRYNWTWAAGDYWAVIDNIIVSQGPPPACSQPSVLSASSITSSGATLGWTENGTATSWQIEYGLLGFTPGTGTTITAGTNPYSLTGLPGANTTYSYYVRANCGVNGYSVWSGPFSFTTLCGSQLSGAVTINPGLPASATNFTSFTALSSELNACGISGPVTVTVAPNSGPYNERFILNAIVGSSAVNTVTINGNNNLLTFNASLSADRATVLFNGTDYVTINNLKIEGQSTAQAHAVHLYNDANYNTFTGCEFIVSETATTSFVNGVVLSSSLTSATTAGNTGNYNTFSNNLFKGGYYGITLMGTSTTVACQQNKVLNNTFTNYYFYGIYLSNQEDAEITANDLSRATRTTLSTFYGVGFFGTNPGTLINRNRIHDNSNSALSNTSAAYPIYASSGAGTVAKPMNIVNNAVYNINGFGTKYGIYLLSNSFYLNIYHNTIDLSNPSQTGTALIAGVYHTGLATGVDLKNNIIVVNNGSTGLKRVLWFSNTAPAFASNYNNLINLSAPGATTVIATRGTTNFTTLIDWQLAAASIYDQNSVDINPVFANVATGNISPLNGGLNNLGTPIPSVTVDLNNVTRSATTPDLGALEFTGIASDLALVSGQLKRGQCYSTNDSVKFTITNVIGGTVDFSTAPVTATWNVTGPTNSNGTITVNTGTLAPGASLVMKGAGVAMPSGGTYTLNGSINSSSFNLSPTNDVLVPVSLIVNKLVQAVPQVTTITNSTDSVELKAYSPFFPNGGFKMTEVCQFKGAVTGWPTWLIADDYIEITGAPFSDLGGITLETWTTTALTTSYTFPSGTILGPNGTAIIAIGEMGASVPSPANFYYHGNGTFTSSYASSTPQGRILKDGLGNILDAVGFSGSTTTAYTFPALANVPLTDWSSSILGGSGTAGIRLEGADVNSGTNWLLCATTVIVQNPNVVNTNVTVPSAPPVAGFNWNLNGTSVSTNTAYWAGPFTTSGTYKYVAAYNSTACGMVYDTATVIVNLPCPFTVEMTDAFGDGWNGATVSFEVNNAVIATVGSTFTSGSTATANIALADMASVVVKLSAAGLWPGEVGFTVKNPQGFVMFTHPYTSSLTTGATLGNFTSQCYVPNCPITDVPAVAAQSSCGPNPVTFTATGNTKPNNQGYFWMRSSDSAIVGTGNQFTTPPITAPATWYAGIGSIDELAPKASAGIPVTGTVGGYGNFTNGMFFTALDFFYLDSMTVRANGPLSFIINISEPIAAGAGALITRSDTIVISAAGDIQVPVDMAFSPGNYFMNMSVIPGSGTGLLWRTTAMPVGVTFPVVTPGIVSITGPNFGTPRWYYFFDWVVSEVCVSSFAAANATFAPVPSVAFPYAENFNTGLPCNWTKDGSGAEWMHTTGYGPTPPSTLNGSAFMMLDDDVVGSTVLTNSSLVSPSFSAIGYDSLWIEFDHYFRATGSSQGFVEVWNGTAWVNVYSTGTTSVGAWSAPNHQMINITAHQNIDLKVRFRYADGGAWGWYWSVDNFEMDGNLAPCQNVVVNVVTDIYGSEASWTIRDTATNIVYASGGPYADITPYNVALATHIDTVCLPIGQFFEFRLEDSFGDGLFDGTNTGTFNAYIICPWGNNTILTGGGASAYGSTTNPPSYDSIVFEVTCLVPCSAPDSLAAAEACTSADLSWSSEANATSTVQWGAAGFTLGSGTIVNNATSPVSITGLIPNTNYSFYVKDTCFSNTTSAWVGPFSFTTDAIPTPTALAATSGCTSTNLSWTTTSSTSTVQWGVAGFTPGSGTFINGATSPVSITGLALGTSYDFYVRDSCGGAAGAWAGPFTFATDDVADLTSTSNVVNVTATFATVDFTTTINNGVNVTGYSWDYNDGSAPGTGAAPSHNYQNNGTYQVVVTATSACGMGYDTITVVVQGIGLDEFGFGNIGLYPNPNDGYFMLTGLTDFGNDATIEVVNLAGAVVYTTSVVANAAAEVKIDLRGLPAGMYHVRVSSEHGAGTKPFIIR